MPTVEKTMLYFGLGLLMASLALLVNNYFSKGLKESSSIVPLEAVLPLDKDVGLLRDTLDELRKEVRELREKVQDKNKVQVNANEPKVISGIEDILLRLAAVERVAADVVSGQITPAERKERAGLDLLGESELGADAAAAYFEIFASLNASFDARVDALKILAMLPEELGAIDPALEEITALFDGAQSELEQEKILDALHGSENSRVINWVGGVVGDPGSYAEDVRYEASKLLKKARRAEEVKSIAARLFETESSVRIRNMLLRAMGE